MAIVAGGGYLIAAAAIGGASAYFQGQQNRRNMKTGINMQQKFMERMRSTQYQTAVEDMKAAGINPMVAYSQGGAGTPGGGGAGATGGTDVGGDALNSAISAKRIQNESRITSATDAKLHAETEYIKENKKVASATALRINEDTRKASADAFRKEGYGDSTLGRTWQTVEKFGKKVREYQWELGGKIYQWLPNLGKWKITEKQQRKNKERRQKSKAVFEGTKKRVKTRRAKQAAGHLRHGHIKGYHIKHGTKKGHSWRSK